MNNFPCRGQPMHKSCKDCHVYAGMYQVVGVHNVGLAQHDLIWHSDLLHLYFVAYIIMSQYSPWWQFHQNDDISISKHMHENIDENLNTVKPLINLIYKETLAASTIADHSDVVGVSPVGAANYIFILDLTSGFKGLGKDTHKMGRETF